MKTMKTCKYGCGKMATGGVAKMKKVKKMADGGQIYGIPQTGTTNYSAPTMKKGGMVKKVNGGKTGAQLKAEGMTMKAKGLRVKEQGKRMKVEGKALKELGQDMKKVGKVLKRTAALEKTNGKYYNPIGRTSYAKGGSTFGMLSVIAGIDKNAGKTVADRIAGAKMKMRKKK
jgi:hypothetical protein